MMRLRSLMMLLLLSCLTNQVLADEVQLRKLLEEHFPGTEIESLRKTPFAGLYEVVVGGEILYTDDQAKYFFMGHLIDTQSRISLTSERMQQIRDARRIPIDTLPLEHSIKVVKGKGERILIVYSDPNCPFCKKLEKELVDIKNITVHTLLYPILNGSMPTATSIWCATDRVKAWDDFMLRGKAPVSKECDTPIQTLLESGQKYRVTGTPTLIFADGSVVSGMIPAAEIEKRLDQAKNLK